jgi:DNA-directed RNA polymerase subunit RPC12/RpoP
MGTSRSTGEQKKYFCKNCGSEFEFGKYVLDEDDDTPHCSLCGDSVHAWENPTFPLTEIPIYETVAAWEARKGREYPSAAPVYIFMPDFGWCLTAWGSFMEKYYGTENSIIAGEAGAPPNDWRP